MAGNYRFVVNQKDIAKLVTTTIDSFIRDRLINKNGRTEHKEQCAERLAAEGGNCGEGGEVVSYSDQAVLANLDWGIEALEEAISTAHMETKLARLDYAEKMLQVCAMLCSDQKTAGVPNFYLSAWAHLNLAYLWKLRNDVPNSVRHVLEMFTVDPFFSRVDFAPELWRDLFLPHMWSIFGWYSEERRKLVMEVIPDSSELSFTIDVDQFFDESLIVRPDQVVKLRELERRFGESLDESTRLYAMYFKDCVVSSHSSSSRKVVPMMPIIEPPMTPLNEVSRTIPNFMKVGPTLPKSAGFSSYLKSRETSRDQSKGSDTVCTVLRDSESARWGPQEGLPEANEAESDYDEVDDIVGMVFSEKEQNLRSPRSTKKSSPNKGSRKTVQQPSKMKSLIHSPTVFSPLCSPKTSSPKVPSPKPEVQNLNEPITLLRLKSIRVADSAAATSLPVSPSMSNGCTNSSIDSDGEEISQSCIQNFSRTPSSHENVDSQTFKNNSVNDDKDENQSRISLVLSDKSTPKYRPPKDFVCPITGQIFNDPVTLETGQTYEKKAIQEWLKRGNTTCPITRQPLSATILPKTNYVLKRLITSWREHLPDRPNEFQFSETPRDKFSHLARDTSLASTPERVIDFPSQKSVGEYIDNKSKRFLRAAISTSPTSVISQDEVEKIVNGLKPYITCLCTSENLSECETAVLEITRLWKDSKGDRGVHSCLSEPTIVNGFVEILSASLSRDVLRMSIYILSELITADENIGNILTSVDSDLDSLAALLKNGLPEAATLICQLRPNFSQLSAHDLVPTLVQLILSTTHDESEDLQFVMDPKEAAIAMLEHILVGGDEDSRSVNTLRLISENGIPALVKLLDTVKVKRSVVSILLCCMQTEKSCRTLIANRIELSHVLELFHAGNDYVRGICAGFLSELVQLNRRTISNRILQTIKDERAFSSMHMFLVYLQMAPMEQQLAVASLLLQLDLLVEPRKMSVYREEAIEVLIEALNQKQFSNYQFMAINVLSSLIGRVTSCGNSYTEAWLLKIAGFNQPYNALLKAEQLQKHDADLIAMMEEEEKAINSWERKLAFVLCNHERGSIFKALEKCLRSSSLERAKECLVIATWLTYMLSKIPDTGVRIAARKSLLDEFINVLQSSKNQDEKILATLALKTFIDDEDATRAMGVYAKCIYKTLRKLKRNSVDVAMDVMKALMALSFVDATELWSCTELVELDLSTNGEVLSLIHVRGRVLSSHSDGTIKVWDAGKRVLRLIQEVCEHSKAVTCLYASPSGDKLYSGSLDKTIRVWAVKPEAIHCIQVHDVREAVFNLTANTKTVCFVSQGTGVKIYDWSGTPKHVNFNKYVKSFAMNGNKLYCGCSSYSIQEVDLRSYTSSTFYSGTRKLLGKQTIYALQIHDGVLFAGGSSVDSTAGKIFLLSTKAIIGSFPTGFDIQQIAINADFVFTATKCGDIEVWLKERFTKVAAIKMSSGNSKITCLTTDTDGGMLYAGSSDGKIQVWDLD